MLNTQILNLSTIFTILILTSCGDSNSPLPTADRNDIDLRSVEPADGLLRLHGSTGIGNFGVPVTGGYDVNGDGNLDFAMASMLSSPESRESAGKVYLVFGDGTVNSSIDTGESNTDVLTIIGDGPSEMTGSEIWMGDVTGDGLGDLLIARQNYSQEGRVGAGALSIIVGSSTLTTLAADGTTIDLRSPPESIEVVTLVGANQLDRLGIWVRTGDITGDGIDDIAVAADQEDTQGINSGTVYVIRGGTHLSSDAEVDLSDVPNSAIASHVAIVQPPAASSDFHFGATLNIADLDDNGTAELMVGATINRAGASIPADGAASSTAVASSGADNGSLYIIWDDNFPETWIDDFTITADENALGGITNIQGAETSAFNNDYFGEEMIGGLDYNGDGLSDMLIGDIAGNTPQLSDAGLGFVFFNAAALKDQNFSMGDIPSGIEVTTILGASSGAISSDTALHGDFDNDGIDDLAVSSPHDAALGRPDAGTLHILWGQSTWPSTIDLARGAQPDDEVFNITNIYGANGRSGSDAGDTLAYSAASADIDNDGLIDLIVNEMVGNGTTPESEDAGNLIILSGALVAASK